MPPVNTSASSPPIAAMHAPASVDDAVSPDGEGELRIRVSGRGARVHGSHVGRAAEADESALLLEHPLQVVAVGSVLFEPQHARPDRARRCELPITRPSSGVKPIVVTTLRPSIVPHSD